MTDTWFVWYDEVPRRYEYGTDTGLELFTDELRAWHCYYKLRLRLYDEAKFQCGEPLGWPGFYEHENGDITFCGRLALRIGEAEWK